MVWQLAGRERKNGGKCDKGWRPLSVLTSNDRAVEIFFVEDELQSAQIWTDDFLRAAWTMAWDN